ncbi:M23 family metallopeptidase [Treponema primitia]|uniref:M23 family metallopeptidase n=1 Tax=Treponema primitia TaxID=88058 RepID=UPI00397FCF4C
MRLNKREFRYKRQGVTLAFFFGQTVSILFLLSAPQTPAQDAQPFPVISRLDSSDTAFRQYVADVEAARLRIHNRERTGEGAESLAGVLTVYAYNPGPRDDAFTLAARCNIPYAALATLNHIPHPDSFIGAPTLLLPSMYGIFIPEKPETDLELLLFTGRAQEEGIPITVTRSGGTERFLFIPGADFSPTERAFFLNTGFRYPLRTYRLSSPFGPRVNPVTGNFRVHQGLDLAAPEGTEVYAARDGEVIEMGTDPIYGNYIIIRHGETWASLYGHLSKFETALRSHVRSGTLIGRVGSTGQSTGPHLHFELRQNGRAQDPGRLLFTK